MLNGLENKFIDDTASSILQKIQQWIKTCLNSSKNHKRWRKTYNKMKFHGEFETDRLRDSLGIG